MNIGWIYRCQVTINWHNLPCFNHYQLGQYRLIWLPVVGIVISRLIINILRKFVKIAYRMKYVQRPLASDNQWSSVEYLKRLMFNDAANNHTLPVTTKISVYSTFLRNLSLRTSSLEQSMVTEDILDDLRSEYSMNHVNNGMPKWSGNQRNSFYTTRLELEENCFILPIKI